VSRTDPATLLPVVDDRQRAQREPGDDFFCLRYEVWYPSFDCALRTRFRTAPGCAGCEQGRFNHRRHGAELDRLRLRWIASS